MSKNSTKTPKSRKAKFTLEPDGFSIHTFQLSQTLTGKEFNQLKSELYPIEGKMYEEPEGHFFCGYYSASGIRVFLHRYIKESAILYSLNLIVNPRKLMNPNCSFLGIFPPKESGIKKLKEDFTELFQDTHWMTTWTITNSPEWTSVPIFAVITRVFFVKQ